MKKKITTYDIKTEMLDTPGELTFYIKKSTLFLSDLFPTVLCVLLSPFFLYIGIILGEQKTAFTILGVITSILAVYTLWNALNHLKKLKDPLGKELMKANKTGIYLATGDRNMPFERCLEWGKISRIILTEHFSDETRGRIYCSRNKILIFPTTTISKLSEKVTIGSARTPEGDKFIQSNLPR